jgi:hypothetical protein
MYQRNTDNLFSECLTKKSFVCIHKFTENVYLKQTRRIVTYGRIVNENLPIIKREFS